MKIAYLDCFAGISGDMFLGALLDAGVPLAVLEEATATLNIGASLRVERVDRSGIMSTKVHVMEGERLAEDATSDAMPEQQEHTHSHHPQTQHEHKGGHHHDHEPHEHAHDETNTHSRDHSHGRSLTEIRRIIAAASLAEPVKRTAIRAFELLGASEAKIHGVDVEQIHFHEVGAVDAIVDIVAASAGIHHLNVGKWFSSAVNVGGGMVECAHGTFPVPAPATADLLRGVPTYSAHVQKELVTPTGAALLRVLDAEFGPQPAMQIESIGYGAGSRNPHGFPNVLRLSLGEALAQVSEMVTVIETAIDDLSPQLLANVAELALTKGALDVMLTPVIMKKGRPGTLITVLASDATTEALQSLLLRETSSLGLRIRRDERIVLERRFETVATKFGEIRIKLGLRGSEVFNAAPEFEDCRAAAEARDVAVKLVQQAAMAAWTNKSAESR
ncbi:hypothetical protein SAMN05421819_3105 [Bryocella elongata]|uniref:Putative nickel insertion protein n=1 Tax=Bryocella elongata TaxID=863522 RepID=A0A1H6AGZ3_9BACT|nr:nickel pincer cofactor biosynthesis protein LarC [Bryocella elongata]SEG47026.1 hypothetical protein SAMN05421819_3105 [Bryocella elongata]